MTTPQPNFGTTFVLRPFAGFDTVYQGKSAAIPIMFTEVTTNSGGGTALDDNAGKPGYDPKLIRGLAVSEGARCIVWLPNVYALHAGVATNYIYSFAWRYRNVFQYRTARGPYHLPFQASGTPDNSKTPTDRIIIPAAWNSTLYAQTEPTSGAAQSNLHVDQIVPFTPFPFGSSVQLPLLPDGTSGIYEQGLLDPAVFGNSAYVPFFNVYDLLVEGDELLLGVTRSTSNVANWGFTSADADNVFGSYFGAGTSQELGIYVNTGVAP